MTALFVTGALVDDLQWPLRLVMVAFAIVATLALIFVQVVLTIVWPPSRVYKRYHATIVLKLDDTDASHHPVV